MNRFQINSTSAKDMIHDMISVNEVTMRKTFMHINQILTIYQNTTEKFACMVKFTSIANWRPYFI